MQKIKATGSVSSTQITGGVKQSLKSISRTWIMTNCSSNNLSGNLQKSAKGKTQKQVFGKDPHPSLITHFLSVGLIKQILPASQPRGIYFTFFKE